MSNGHTLECIQSGLTACSCILNAPDTSNEYATCRKCGFSTTEDTCEMCGHTWFNVGENVGE